MWRRSAEHRHWGQQGSWLHLDIKSEFLSKQAVKITCNNREKSIKLSAYAVWKLIFKTITFWTGRTVLTIHDHGEPILWIHRLKDNHNGDKSPFTFYPYLGITRWLVPTGKKGKASRTSFFLCWVLVADAPGWTTACRFIVQPEILDIPTCNTRRPACHNDASDPNSERWNYCARNGW
jgi:hypothetical protein